MHEYDFHLLFTGGLDDALLDLRLPGDACQAIKDAAHAAGQHPGIVSLMERFAAANPEDRKALEGEIRAAAGAHAALFPLLVLLARIPWLKGRYREYGISQEIYLHTLSDVGIWLLKYREGHGTWGIDEYGWLSEHFAFRLFRLGRIQFLHQNSLIPAHAFRHKEGSILLLCPHGHSYRPDGQADGTNGVYAPSPFAASFSETQDGYSGHPISPMGTASAKARTLPKNQWTKILSPGDPVLDMHIAAGEPLTPESAVDSLRFAHRFYQKHFPNLAPRGFTCHSWLLGWPLTRMLDRRSNITRFQELFYRVPMKDTDFQTFERVFGKKPEDFSAAPRDSALKRALIAWYQRGEHTFSAGGFIPYPYDENAVYEGRES